MRPLPVPNSIASTPIRAWARSRAPSSRSPGVGLPASRIWRSSRARAKPAPPASSDAQTRACSSWLATTTNGCLLRKAAKWRDEGENGAADLGRFPLDTGSPLNGALTLVEQGGYAAGWRAHGGGRGAL
jgi:hypothetical protein